MNVYFPEALYVNHSPDIEDGHFGIPTISYCSGRLALRYTVVEKLVMHALAGTQRPGEKQFWHAGISFDIVREQILNCFVSANLQSSQPSTLNRHFRRRNHEKHIDEITKPGQQSVRSLAFQFRHEAIEPKAVDQQMRHSSSGSPRRHTTVELLVDDFDLVARQSPSVFVSRT